MERLNDKLQQIIGVHPHKLDFVNGIAWRICYYLWTLSLQGHNKESLSLCLVDLEKAFNTIYRSGLMQILQSYGVIDDMAEIIRRHYINKIG